MLTEKPYETATFLHQEKAEPVISVMIRTGRGSAEVHQCYQRVEDAVIADGLDIYQRGAAKAIWAAYQLISSGMGAKSAMQILEYLPGTGGSSDYVDRAIDLMEKYHAWRKQCTREKLKPEIPILYYAFGEKMRVIERGQRVRNGAGLYHMRQALQLYVDLNKA